MLSVGFSSSSLVLNEEWDASRKVSVLVLVVSVTDT